ncbi:MAG: HEAT repeat domain-containing protein [Gemmataceae bacterium]|nr:HEAT repeat domain-containing protein [Gemmataceae bacterium]
MYRLFALCSVAIACTLAAERTRAEVFLLENEGRIQGEWLNKEDAKAEHYLIRTETGGTVKLARDQVKKVYVPSEAELEYEKIRDTYPDTAAGQWDLAEWCREKSLRDPRNKHLERVIELDPDHKDARRALGYVLIENEWKTQDQVYLERGYVRYQGRWRLPQEVELLELRRKNKKETGAWFVKIKRWRVWLDDERAEQAETLIRDVTDPNAVPALAQYFEGEKNPTVRLLFVEALAQVATGDAIYVLGDGALYDGDLEVRLTCLDYLKKEPRPELVKYYAGVLKHKDNTIVNRAAYCLKELKDDSAVSALIESLVTTHKTKVTSGGNNQYSATFGGPNNPSGGLGASPSGLSVGASAKVITEHLRNTEVLDALVKLTGANFGYDKQAWKYWLTSQQKAPTANVRRDEG